MCKREMLVLDDGSHRDAALRCTDVAAGVAWWPVGERALVLARLLRLLLLATD